MRFTGSFSQFLLGKIGGIPTDTKIFNDENSLREIIYREFLILGANVDRECLSGSGRADIIVKSDLNYYVFELKPVFHTTSNKKTAVNGIGMRFTAVL